MPPGILNPTVPDFAAAASSSASAFDMEPHITAIFTAKTSQESLEASLTLCNEIVANAATAHHVVAKLLPELAKAAADKKSGNNRESAMIVYGALYETLPTKAPATEVLLVEAIGIVFDGLADKGAVVRESAQYAVDALFGVLKHPALVSGLLGAVQNYCKSAGSKWQGKVGAYTLIGKMADKAVKADQTQGEVFLKDVMGRELEGLIPVVEAGMHDLKSEVCSANSHVLSEC
jgi:elongation factor 3